MEGNGNHGARKDEPRFEGRVEKEGKRNAK